VATTPIFDVAAAMIAAKGAGSCLGAMVAYFRYTSELPPYASDTMSVSSIMM
jgi:hypothetical protein